MAKNESRPTETTGPAGSTGADLEALQAKVAPLDEFRGRAESWMKEITAQVARLAGKSEDEERRKGALDKRLSDIDERMQSLLTLTELVSLSKNPFAGPPREAPTQAAEPKPVAARSETPPGPAAPDTTEPAAAPAVAPTPPAETPAPSAPSPPAPIPAATRRLHPNDAAAENGRIAPHSNGRSVADTFPRKTAPDAKPSVVSDHQRFVILEWARLLAPAVLRVDLGGFLGVYVEAGWISADVASTVRNLTLQLARDAIEHDPPTPVDELHARSMLLVGHLNGAPARAETARTTLLQAREVARGDWLAIQG